MADPVAWLNRNVEGFEALPTSERDAIMHFALLWSLFEGRALNNSASADAIVSKVRAWVAEGVVQLAHVDASLAYFRNRYFDGRKLTEHFDGMYGLRFRRSDNKETVEAVVRGVANGAQECVSAVLIIIYRLRNNLFHGEKWKYGIQGQFENFNHANQTLMNILEAINPERWRPE